MSITAANLYDLGTNGVPGSSGHYIGEGFNAAAINWEPVSQFTVNSEKVERTANSNGDEAIVYDMPEFTYGEGSLTSRLNALLEAGRFDQAYDLILKQLQNMGSETNPEKWMNMLLLADEVSDILYAHGREGLSRDLDHRTARSEHIALEKSAFGDMALGSAMYLTLERNDIQPSDGLSLVLKDIAADIQNTLNRTETLEANDPEGQVQRPDTSMLQSLLEGIVSMASQSKGPEGTTPQSFAQLDADAPKEPAPSIFGMAA